MTQRASLGQSEDTAEIRRPIQWLLAVVCLVPLDAASPSLTPPLLILFWLAGLYLLIIRLLAGASTIG